MALPLLIRRSNIFDEHATGGPFELADVRQGLLKNARSEILSVS
jgi:hypothetical protein